MPTDSERLDWLEDHLYNGGELTANRENWPWVFSTGLTPGNAALREAIDKTMEAEDDK